LPYTHTIFRILRMIDLLKITIKRSSRQVLTLSLFLSLSHSLSFSISTSHIHAQTHTPTTNHQHTVFSNFFDLFLKILRLFSKKLKTAGKKLSNLKKLEPMFNKNIFFFSILTWNKFWRIFFSYFHFSEALDANCEMVFMVQTHLKCSH